MYLYVPHKGFRIQITRFSCKKSAVSSIFFRQTQTDSVWRIRSSYTISFVGVYKKYIDLTPNLKEVIYLEWKHRISILPQGDKYWNSFTCVVPLSKLKSVFPSRHMSLKVLEKCIAITCSLVSNTASPNKGYEL